MRCPRFEADLTAFSFDLLFFLFDISNFSYILSISIMKAELIVLLISMQIFNFQKVQQPDLNVKLLAFPSLKSSGLKTTDHCWNRITVKSSLKVQHTFWSLQTPEDQTQASTQLELWMLMGPQSAQLSSMLEKVRNRFTDLFKERFPFRMLTSCIDMMGYLIYSPLSL